MIANQVFVPLSEYMQSLDWLTHANIKMLDDMQHALELGLISNLQFNIIVERFCTPDVLTYAAIQTTFGLSGPLAVERCLHRTSLLLPWDLGMNGGSYSYLSEYDQKELEHYLEEMANQYNCVPERAVRDIIYKLALKRAKSARAILDEADCPTLANKVTKMISDLLPPDLATVRRIAAQIDFRICNPQELDEARRKGCDKEVITEFFTKFGPLLQATDPRLIFNMDETMLDSRKQFKVLVRNGKRPLIRSYKHPPHLTGVCAFSAKGYRCRPMIILPVMKNYIDVQFDGPGVDVCRTETGWINKSVFFYWAYCFCSDMSKYRLELGDEMRHKPILLLVDGHLSRLCWKAMWLFRMHNIQVIVFPGHTSHLLQPFDVAVAAPLKAAYQANFERERSILEQDSRWSEKIPIHRIRYAMCRAFIGAFMQAATLQNIEAGFREAGIVPCDPARPLESDYCPDATDESRLYRSRMNPGLANNRLLTSTEEIMALRRADGMANVTPETLGSGFDLRREILELKEGKKNRILSRVRTIMISLPDGYWTETRFG
jgi:hypothetical protein